MRWQLIRDLSAWVGRLDTLFLAEFQVCYFDNCKNGTLAYFSTIWELEQIRAVIHLLTWSKSTKMNAKHLIGQLFLLWTNTWLLARHFERLWGIFIHHDGSWKAISCSPVPVTIYFLQLITRFPTLVNISLTNVIEHELQGH